MDCGQQEKTQHVGLGSAALAAAGAALPAQVRRPEFPERDNCMTQIVKKKKKKVGGIFDPEVRQPRALYHISGAVVGNRSSSGPGPLSLI